MKTARFNDPIARGELLQMVIAIKLGINVLIDKIKGEGK